MCILYIITEYKKIYKCMYTSVFYICSFFIFHEIYAQIPHKIMAWNACLRLHTNIMYATLYTYICAWTPLFDLRGVCDNSFMKGGGGKTKGKENVRSSHESCRLNWRRFIDENLWSAVGFEEGETHQEKGSYCPNWAPTPCHKCIGNRLWSRS